MLRTYLDHSSQCQEMKRMAVTLLLLPLLLLLLGREADGCMCYLENWTCRSGHDGQGQEDVLPAGQVWDHFHIKVIMNTEV